MMHRASPGTGHNLPDPADVRRALAIEILDQEEARKLRERRKANRKFAEGKNVNLQDLDTLYKHKDDSIEEVLHWVRRKINGFSALFNDVGQQFDIFAGPAESTEVRSSVRHTGFMAGISGKPLQAPPGSVGDKLQQYNEGWHEGAAARKGAEEEKIEIMRKALENADKGKVTDGTTGEAVTPKPKRGAKAKATGDQAAKDFAEDNAPDWSGYSAMPAEWTDDQRKTAKAWVDSVPLDVEPKIEHPGAKTFYDVQRKAARDLAKPEAKAEEPAAEPETPAPVSIPVWMAKLDDDPANWFAADRTKVRVYLDTSPVPDHAGVKAFAAAEGGKPLSQSERADAARQSAGTF